MCGARRYERSPERIDTRVGHYERKLKKIYRHIEAWRNRTIEGDFPYLFLDGLVLSLSAAGRVKCETSR